MVPMPSSIIPPFPLILRTTGISFTWGTTWMDAGDHFYFKKASVNIN